MAAPLSASEKSPTLKTAGASVRLWKISQSSSLEAKNQIINLGNVGLGAAASWRHEHICTFSDFIRLTLPTIR